MKQEAITQALGTNPQAILVVKFILQILSLFIFKFIF